MHPQDGFADPWNGKTSHKVHLFAQQGLHHELAILLASTMQSTSIFVDCAFSPTVMQLYFDHIHDGMPEEQQDTTY